MASESYRPGECGETSGFLFSHRCGDLSINVCGQCQKPICQRHMVVDQDLILCTTCGKARMRSGQMRNSDQYRDDPYFYSMYHSGPYYSNDFTDSDEQVVSEADATTDDVKSFEKDMGAS